MNSTPSLEDMVCVSVNDKLAGDGRGEVEFLSDNSNLLGADDLAGDCCACTRAPLSAVESQVVACSVSERPESSAFG
jgi:hypothetical protein